MPATKIDVKQDGIGRVLKEFWLRVPRHQREYAWEEEHVTTLFEDLTAALRQDQPAPYFLGTIVTVDDGPDARLVVDGQQRLATTSILLAAMREYLLTRGATTRAEAIERLLWEIDSDLQEKVPKLTLNTADAGLFGRIITTGQADESRSPLQSHRRLIQARDLARAHVANIVAGMPDTAHSNELNRWFKYIQHSVEVVLLTVPDRRTAFRMFQTLNDRGLTASKADLIKSHLLEMAGKREDEVAERWSNLRITVESAAPDDIDAMLDFLRYALIAQRGHLREAKIFERVQEMVDSESTAATQAETLERLAGTYVATMNPYHDKWASYPTRIRHSLTEHRTLDIAPMKPLLMAVGAAMDPKEAAEAFSFLVSLAVRLNIASSTRTGTVEERLGNVAQQVLAGSIASADELRESLTDITPMNGAFREKFARRSETNGKRVRYYLRALEDQHNGARDNPFEPVDDAERFDRDHVLPIKPEPGWNVDADTVAQYAMRLGNQVLLRKPDNAGLRSKPFAERIQTYRTSRYLLTQEVANESVWDPSAIERRQERLADLALLTWPIASISRGRAPKQPRSKSPQRPQRPHKVQPEDVNEIAYRTMREATDT